MQSSDLSKSPDKCKECRSRFVTFAPRRFAGIREPDRRRSYQGSILCIECEDVAEEREANP
jgi:hypothetical protein